MGSLGFTGNSYQIRRINNLRFIYTNKIMAEFIVILEECSEIIYSKKTV